MNSTDVNLTSINPNLLIAPQLLNIYFGLFILITGNFSTLGNIIVFTSRTFRIRAYSIYLIAEAACTFIYFNYVLLTRIIQNGFQISLINRYNSMCKTRQFFSQYAQCTAYTFYTLATIDRLLSTQRSMTFRRWGNRVTLAYKIIPIVFCIWFVLIGHRLFLYNISLGICLAYSDVYEKYNTYFEIIVSAVCPPILLIILGILLLKSVKQIAQRRIIPAVSFVPARNVNQRYINKIDGQITTMLILQIFIAVPSFLLGGCQLIYSNTTEYWDKTPLQVAWENLLYEIIRLLFFAFYSTSFYISFISSRGFRRQILRSLSRKHVHAHVANTQMHSSFA